MKDRFFHVYTPGERRAWCGVSLGVRFGPGERVAVCQMRTAAKERPIFFTWEHGTNICVDCAFAWRARSLPRFDPKVWQSV